MAKLSADKRRQIQALESELQQRKRHLTDKTQREELDAEYNSKIVALKNTKVDNDDADEEDGFTMQAVNSFGKTSKSAMKKERKERERNRMDEERIIACSKNDLSQIETDQINQRIPSGYCVESTLR